MGEENFRLPASSYEEITKIIKAYGQMKAPAVPKDLSHHTAQNPTMISANNAFLVGVGIVEGGKKKVMTEKGSALARALDHDMPDDIRLHWRNVVSESEFFQKLLSAISIRKGMEPSTLQAHVAYSAGQPKTKQTMTGASAVVDILIASGMVIEEGGKLIISREESPKGHEEEIEIDQSQQPPTSQKDTTLQSTIVTIPQTGSRSISIQIQIQIQCSPSEIDTLGPKLRDFIKTASDINESEE